VRPLYALTSTAALVLVAPPARAEKPEPATAFLAGASVFLAGFAIGGVLLATSHDHAPQDNAGWLTIETGFALAPFASHALVGEWTRALAYSAPPALVIAGTATVFGIDPAGVEHGPLGERYVLWTLLGAGLFSGAIGVVDSTLADRRASHGTRAAGGATCSTLSAAVAPVVGSGQLGLMVSGTL
jgi:hypothetical protein